MIEFHNNGRVHKPTTTGNGTTYKSGELGDGYHSVLPTLFQTIFDRHPAFGHAIHTSKYHV